MQPNYKKVSFLNASGTFIYISIIGFFMSNVEKIFGPGPDTFVAPIFVLLLFVISACITSGLVLGKPLMMYLDGQKREAVKLVGYTVVWLAVFFLVVLICVVLARI